MCGIVGAMALGKVTDRQEKLRQESMIFLTTELLQLTQERGTDATGTAILFNDGNFVGLKMGISSPEFISRFGGSKTDFEGFLKLWRKNDAPVKTYLGHCRKTSIGSAKDNSNNHPIKVGNIVGIHNGTLTNHEVIFKKLECKRDGDVDSEAIIRMLHFYSKKGTNPFTTEMLKEVCLRLQGTYSVLAYNADNPNQVISFRDGKPAIAALIRPLNLLLMASEEKFIKQVLFRYNKHGKLYPLRMKFPVIKKDDIDIKIMLDDTCAVFDLSEKVEKDTNVVDLFESEKVLRIEKKWKKITSSYNRSNNYNANSVKNNTVINNTTKTETKSKSKTENKTNIKAKVWNKELKEFDGVDSEQEERLKKIKSIEIDDAENIKYIENEDDDVKTITAASIHDKEDKIETKEGEIPLKKVTKEKVNGLIGNSAKIEDEPVEYKGEVEIINPSTGKASTTPKGITVEVDTNINPAAMEAALKAASIQPKFENDDEVLDELDVDNKKKLENLQLFALTNRISKMVFRRAFYKGFVEGLSNNKMKKAENRIKTLKTITKIFIKALRSTSKQEIWKQGYIKNAVDDERKLTVDEITKVFSAGDVRDNPELEYLRDKCTK